MVTDCFADGEPFPQVVWFKNDKELRDSEDPNISFHRNSIIIFLQSNWIGYTSYFCQAESDVLTASM